MKKNFYIALIFILIYPAIAKKSTIMQSLDNVKGGYKECTGYQYNFINGNIDLKSKFKIYSAKYDNKGRIIESFGFKPDSSISMKSYYKYDNADNLIEEFLYRNTILIFGHFFLFL